MSTEELKMSKDKLDVIKGLKINPEDMEKIPDPLDRKFLYISGALAYINGLNSLDRTIQDMIRQVKLLIPIQTDELKIIISRLEDISPSEIDKLVYYEYEWILEEIQEYNKEQEKQQKEERKQYENMNKNMPNMNNFGNTMKNYQNSLPKVSIPKLNF